MQVLIAVARHHGLELTEGSLLHQYNLDGSGFSPERLIKILRDHQFRTRQKKLSWAVVNQLGEAYPAIMPLKNGHYVIVAGSRENPDGTMQLAILDPLRDQAGFIFINAQQYAEIGTGEIILTKRVESRRDAQRSFNLSWFLWHMWRERSTFGHIAVAALFLIGLGLVTPLFFQIVIDKVLLHESRTTLTVMGLGVIVALGFEILLGYLRTSLLLHAANRLDVQLGGKTFAHLMSLPLHFFDKSASGVVAKHMQQTEQIREFLAGAMFLTLLDAVALVIFLPILFAYSTVLGSVVLGVSVLMALIILAIMPGFTRALHRLYQTEGERQAMLVETIHGMRTVKSLALEPRQNRRWNDRTAQAVTARFKVGQLGNLAKSLIGLADKLLTVAIVWVGAELVFGGKLTVGELVAIQMLAGRVSQPLTQLAGLANQFQQTRLSVQMLGEIMNRQPERGPRATPLRPIIGGGIAVEDVTYSYPMAASPALQNLALEIPAGSRIGIVGKSGSGKSTFTRLLQGLYVPDAGFVRFDGVDLREIDLAHLRRHIGVVLQESFLFTGTVRENIAATRPTASFAEIVAAARIAGADEFIQRLPQGYDTHLEENASNLSGGQKQRLAIARAILPQPPILIFDEATSALDPESEAIVQDNLDAITEGKTFIAISHRLTTLVNCDRIYVFDQGRIIASGTHQELLNSATVYQDLWRQQTRHLQIPASPHGAGVLS